MNRYALLLAALALPPILADEYPTYEDLARLPSSYISSDSVRFTMRFQGIQEVDDCFAAIGRNAATHVQVTTPRVPGAKEALPIFVSRSKSAMIERMRESDRGVSYYFRGRMKYFKSEYYPPPEPGAPRSATVKVEQSKSLDEYYLTARSNRPSSGEVLHYVFDLYEFRELKDHEKPAEAAPERPEPEAGYQSAGPRDLAARAEDSAGRPIRIPYTYQGALGRLVAEGGSAAALDAFRRPEATCVTETDIDDAGRDPTDGLKAFEVGRLTVVFSDGWDVAATLGSLDRGDTVELRGVLTRGDGGALLLLIEGIEKSGSGGRRERR